jgi:short-subunit dehydrogenase
VSRISLAGLGWYASTKHALRAMSDALRQEVGHLGIQVVTIEPGAVKTGFDAVGIPTMDKITPPSDYQNLHDGFKNYLVNSYSGCPGPESTVKAMVKAMTAAKPRTVYKTTTDAKLLPKVRSMLRNRMYDRIILSQIKKAEGS